MALRLPANLHTYASLPCKKSGASSCSSSSNSRRRFSGINLIVCSSSLDEQRRRVGGGPAVASPLQVAEEIAARFGLEMAVAGLERIYSEYDRGDGPPAFSDPGSPGRPLRVVYQGVRGSYCQEAAAAAFNSSTAAEDSGRLSFLPCSNMEDAFAALEDGSADRAVAPMENSLDGPIHRNLDLLIRHPGSASSANSSSPSTTASSPYPAHAGPPSAASSATPRPSPTAASASAASAWRLRRRPTRPPPPSGWRRTGSATPRLSGARWPHGSSGCRSSSATSRTSRPAPTSTATCSWRWAAATGPGRRRRWPSPWRGGRQTSSGRCGHSRAAGCG
ncbi:unnamed protein product [Musa textilis]